MISVSEHASSGSFRSPARLAAAITRAASKQTYYTVRFFVDRDRAADAYRAYAYFRWLDDRLDGPQMDAASRRAFVEQQSSLMERLYRGEGTPRLLAEERLLADLIRGDRQPDSGLRCYIYHMMAVMVFDAERRGGLVSGAELENYTRWLAAAVTEALHYFIGHRCGSPQNRLRYRAAVGAHIVHMLRDTFDDIEAGYFNIPREVVEAGGIDPHDVQSPAYRAWVRQRADQARECFRAGRAYLAQVQNPRCRLAGHAYMARFESVLDTIERDGYRLRKSYPERRALNAGVRAGLAVLSEALPPHLFPMRPRRFSVMEG
jgi:phytoene/squalene synthetase